MLGTSSEMTKLATQAVEKKLHASLRKLTGVRCVLLFSGGFDSILLAVLARRYGVRVTAVTVRFEDFNPQTVAEAVSQAQRMGLPHHIIHVTLAEFLAAFKSLPLLTDRPICDLDLVLVHAAFRKYNPKIAGKVFISAMGSDQWFGDRAFEQAAVDEDAHHQVARADGYRFLFPFLTEQMRVLSGQLPAALKKNKNVLRRMLPDDRQELFSGRTGKREIQVPINVRRLLLWIYDGRKSVRADDQEMRRLMNRLWQEKNGGDGPRAKGRKR